MPNEPLAPHPILADLPDEADYDAAHAALMATERGRRFLSEYAGRNRNADTTMVVAAIARIEAAIRGGVAPQPGAAGGGDLVEIADALDRLRADVAAGESRTPDLSGAVERIQDIAFVLHERPVEQTLCDGLDAAIREIAGVHAATSTLQGGTGMAQLIAALADRVRAMIAPPSPQTEALPQTEASPQSATLPQSPAMELADPSSFISADGADQLEAGSDPAMPAPEQLFDFPEGGGEALADAVTSLAAALPRPATVAEQTTVAVAAPQVTMEVAVTAEVSITAEAENDSPHEQFDMAADEEPTAPLPAAMVHREGDGAAAAESVDDMAAAIPADDEPIGASSPGDMLSSEDILNQALSSNGHFVRLEQFDDGRSTAGDSAGAPPHEAAELPSASGAAIPSTPDGPGPAVTAQEEADDLFGPMPIPMPIAASPPPIADRDVEIASPSIPVPAPEAAATQRPVAPPPPHGAAVTPPSAQMSQPMTAASQAIASAAQTIAAPTSQQIAQPVATMAMPRMAPRPPAADPLAAVRALSEEEVIALFS